MTLTANQQSAVHEPGNLLVMAAAGAGKTGTLVQRCLRLLVRSENPVPIRRILVVTFTEAAAAEVRARIRQKLEEASAADPANEHLQMQLASIDSAYISTLHSFCFQLVRRHVLQLGLDPAISVLEPHQSKMEFHKTLDLLLREHYADRHENSAELKQLIRSYYGGWAGPLRTFVENLHEFTQTRPDPEGWFAKALEELAQTTCPKWHEWYRAAIVDLCDYWTPYLERLPVSNTNACECAALLRAARLSPDPAVLQQILTRDSDTFWPEREKTKFRKPFEKLFADAEFLASFLVEEGSAVHPIDEDWNWMRAPLQILLRFAQQFSARFRSEKSERGVVDFHDLEQLALQLLIDPTTGRPSELASEWQEKFEAVFVDEYQDINAAQDLILTAISSEAPPGNRFLVGDPKQSIYRFRQANPAIFQRYVGRSGWKTIFLSENFRSHEGLLKFANPLFRWLMNRDFGGLEYTDEAALRFGNPAARANMLAVEGQAPPVELHLFLTDQELERDENDEEAELENAEIEARLVALRLRELKESSFTIYQEKEKRHRPVEWRDMVVLLRAAKNRLETYAKAFAEAGVPLQTKRNAFFSTQEVLDLCNVLNILDNPIQDIPLAGVLRSPLAGLTANELAAIRIHGAANVPFWRALNDVYERKVPGVPREKIERFLKQFHKWRNTRRCSSLAQRLDLVLTDTGYDQWLLAQPRGRERFANVQQLIRIARQFDESRGESLYLFLRHLEELQDAAGDIEPAGCVEENSVRLMTVHQSKGLEFPVVALADLGKQFNLSGQPGGVIMHDQYGLCSMVKPPHTGQRYPSLPLWLARRAERFESIGEEMRVLYVALTRAQNHLLLFGSSTEKAAARWTERARQRPLPQELLQHRSWLDWIGAFASLQKPNWQSDDEAVLDSFAYKVHRGGPKFAETAVRRAPEVDLSRLDLEFSYLHEASTRQAAKTSVTALRKTAETDHEVFNLGLKFRGDKSGAERGLATHTFLEHLVVSRAKDLPGLQAEAERLVQKHVLTAEQASFVDLEGVAAFWSSPIGAQLIRREHLVRRELPFTFKATREDLCAVNLDKVLSLPSGEFIVIQGIADLILLDPKEIWLIDFKSDRLERSDLKSAAERYKPQIRLYAVALEAIYHRRVTRKGIFFLHLREFAWYKDKAPVPPPVGSFEQLELGV